MTISKEDLLTYKNEVNAIPFHSKVTRRRLVHSQEKEKKLEKNMLYDVDPMKANRVLTAFKCRLLHYNFRIRL